MSPILSGMVVALMATQAASASQNGNQLPYRHCFEATAKTYNLDSDWLTAIAIVESSLNPKAVSSANAVGLMQIKWPQTAAHLGATSRASLFDPCTNVDLGGRYLRELTDRYKGNMQRALAAYRIGPTALARANGEPEVVLEYRRRINEQLDILRPSSTQNRASKATPQSDMTPTPVPVKRQSRTTVTTRPLVAEKTTMPPAEPAPTTLEPTPRAVTQPIMPPPRCDLRTLQLESLSTHHPAKREQRFFDWLTANGGVCSLRHLIQVKNQMTVWLGTAAGSKRIDLSLEKHLQASQTKKTPG